MDTGNYRNRVLNPLAEKLELPKLNFQILRRTMATQAEHGFGEGHPGAPAACEGRHYGQRVHAGVAGEREEDGRRGVRHAHERREVAKVFAAFATKSRKLFRGTCCKNLK